MRRIALWKAQKGSYVATLEQFQASISLTSTLKTIWSLRAFTLNSIALVFIWSFYYLGSQAARREFVTTNSGNTTTFDIAVLNTVYGTSILGSQTLFYLYLPSNSLYTTSLLSTTDADSATADTWGNVRIPTLDSLETNALAKAEAKLDTWIEVPDDVTYSSLVGVPVFSSKTNLYKESFSMNASYIDLTCSTPRDVARSSFPNVTELQSYSVPVGSGIQTLAFTVLESALDGDSPKFSIWSLHENANSVSTASCSVAMMYAEVAVSCSTGDCAVTKMRNTTSDYPTTISVNPFTSELWMNVFFQSFATASGLPTEINISTFSEYYLTNETSQMMQPETRIDLSSLSAAQLSTRLGQLLNSYYLITTDPGSTFGSTSTSVANVSSLIENSYGLYNASTATGSPLKTLYDASMTWITIDIVSSVLLFFSAVLSAYFRTRILAPDIFGYVSSLTRDNPHVAVPAGGSALSGMERARMMRNVKIRIGDVEGQKEVGAVGVGSLHPGEEKEGWTGLNKGKVYV